MLDRQHRTMRILTILAIVAVFAGSSVHAAQAQHSDEYNRVIKEAVVEYSAQNWSEARVLFTRAHELDPSARTFRGLGLTAFELRRYVESIAALEAALADERKPLTAKQRGEVETLLSRARQYVAEYQLDLQPTGAATFVDGKELVLSEGKLHLDPGPHTLVVRAEGFLEARKELQVEAGAREVVSIELAPADVPPESAPAPEPSAVVAVAAPSVDKPPRRRLWTWGLGGASAAALVTGAGLYVAAYRKVTAYEDKDCDGTAPPSSCARIKSKGEGLYLGSIIAAAASGALLAGAAVAFVLEGRDTPTSSSTTLLIRPNGLAIAGSF